MALGLLDPLEYDAASLVDRLREIGRGVRTFVTPYISPKELRQRAALCLFTLIGLGLRQITNELKEVS
jgi:hypothetical protein